MNNLPIKWSLYAKQSLDSIVSFIRRDSPSNAKMVKRTLVNLIGTLNDFPEKYPRDTFISKNKGNYRFATKWNYKIVYEITANEIIIIDIFHTAQKPSKVEDALK